MNHVAKDISPNFSLYVFCDQFLSVTMPALAFGLKPNKNSNAPAKVPVKRKAAFEAEDQEVEDDDGAFGALSKSKPKAKLQLKHLESDLDERPRKSPKLEDSGKDASRYSNLSAIRSAKLQDAEASKVDATVYDYDAVYDTFNADKQKKKADTEEGGVPKYMTNLLASAEVRKRDQLRAKEKALQKERDAEGDEFADKDKFVTSAYKKQQEENRRLEEEERMREEAEEERRRKGGGMTAFHKDLLKKDEERQMAVEEATKLVQTSKSSTEDDKNVEDEKTDNKLAAELNQKGANIVTNDDGEIIDKRQLLSAGLNVAPKKPTTDKQAGTGSAPKAQEWQRSAKQQDARLSQRERQSRMMERQIEEIEAKQKETEAAEQQALEEKNKTKLTDNDKLSAKERYIQRKKEREEAAKQAKTG